jgi:hypothetical protein
MSDVVLYDQIMYIPRFSMNKGAMPFGQYN